MYNLRSNKIFQHPDSVQIPSHISDTIKNDELIKIALEMDRRLIQLWDKVSFERDKNRREI